MYPYSEQVEVEALLQKRPLQEEPDIRSQLQELGIRSHSLQPVPRCRRRRRHQPRLLPVPTPGRHLLPVLTPDRRLLRVLTPGRRLLPGPPVAVLVVVVVAVAAVARVPGPCRLRLLFAHPVITFGRAW